MHARSSPPAPFSSAEFVWYKVIDLQASLTPPWYRGPAIGQPCAFATPWLQCWGISGLDFIDHVQILIYTCLSCQAVFAQTHCRSLVQAFLFVHSQHQAMDSGGTETRNFEPTGAQSQAQAPTQNQAPVQAQTQIHVRTEGFTTLSDGGELPVVE